MITVKEHTTLVGVSELRTNIDKVIEESKKHKVLIERRNKPIAVLMTIEKYSNIEKILDTLEDVALGYLAKERDFHSNRNDYIDLNEFEKKIKK